MLYDPKWETKKPDVFSLESLIAWLETRPADKEYCFMSNDGCMLAQYYLAIGFKKVDIGGMSITLDGHWQNMPDDFADIPADWPRTYGGALARARKAHAQ